jgi:phospholipid transport system substrate-binding protein
MPSSRVPVQGAPVKRRFLSILLASLTFAFAVTAWAGPALDTVKSKQTELFQLLAKSDDASNKRIAQLFDEMLDYQRLAEASLGDEWAKLKPEQQKEFTDLLTQLVRRSYEKNLRKTLSFDIEYLKEEKAGDGSVMVVRTRAVHKTDKREEPISIDFAMVERDGKWRVKDIVTDEISLVSSYKGQFTRIIKKDGFPALITKMKDKIAKGDV